MFQKRVRFPNILIFFNLNLFLAEPETKEEPKADEGKTDETPAPEEPQTQPKKKLQLPSIKLPQLSAIIPKRFQRQQPDDIELGNGPQTRAGLASMETLDDSSKDPEKDTVDKAAAGEVKSEPNGNGAKADEQKAEKENEENAKSNTTFAQRLRGYKCSIGEFLSFHGFLKICSFDSSYFAVQNFFDLEL